MLNQKKIIATSVLLAASSHASADGLITDILNTVTTWSSLAQTAALAVSGLLGLVLFVSGALAFKGNQQSQTTKGMATISVIIGLVLMYAAYMIKGAASELGIDSTASSTSAPQINQMHTKTNELDLSVIA